MNTWVPNPYGEHTHCLAEPMRPSPPKKKTNVMYGGKANTGKRPWGHKYGFACARISSDHHFGAQTSQALAQRSKKKEKKQPYVTKEPRSSTTLTAAGLDASQQTRHTDAKLQTETGDCFASPSFLRTTRTCASEVGGEVDLQGRLHIKGEDNAGLKGPGVRELDVAIGHFRLVPRARVPFNAGTRRASVENRIKARCAVGVLKHEPVRLVLEELDLQWCEIGDNLGRSPDRNTEGPQGLGAPERDRSVLRIVNARGRGAGWKDSDVNLLRDA